MALRTTTLLGQGGSGLNDRLPLILAELQSLKFKTVTGAAAVTNIAIAGITTKATIVAAVNLTDLADVSELPAVTSAGNIRFPTANTSSKQLLIVYYAG